MKLIQRYLAVTVMNASLLVLFVLTIVNALASLLRQIYDIGSGQYHISQAFLYVLMNLPQQVYTLFPMAGLLGSLIGLGLLASRSELIVMQTAGITVKQISKTVLLVAIGLVLVVTLLGETLGPSAVNWAEKKKFQLISNGKTLATAEGVWIREGDSFIHIDKILSGPVLSGVTRYQFDVSGRLTEAGFSKDVIYKGKNWIAQDTVLSKISEEKVISGHAVREPWEVKLNAEVFGIKNTDPYQMSLFELYTYMNYLNSNGLNDDDYQLAFWQRIFQPFATGIMILLGIPFIFGSLRTATMGLRILVGVCVGFGFYLLNQFFGPVSVVYQLPPILAAALPSLLCLLLVYFLMKKVR